MRLCAAGAIVAASSLLVSAQAPSQAEVLARVAADVAGFRTQLARVVLEDSYPQEVRSASTDFRANRLPAHRQLRSDLLLVRPLGEESWLQFRDVFEVDGKPVRDRDERLEKLFLKPSATAF